MSSSLRIVIAPSSHCSLSFSLSLCLVSSFLSAHTHAHTSIAHLFFTYLTFFSPLFYYLHHWCACLSYPSVCPSIHPCVSVCPPALLSITLFLSIDTPSRLTDSPCLLQLAFSFPSSSLLLHFLPSIIHSSLLLLFLLLPAFNSPFFFLLHALDPYFSSRFAIQQSTHHTTHRHRINTYTHGCIYLFPLAHKQEH